LAATAAEKMLKLWDVASGQLVRSMEHGKEEIDAVLFSPDGSLVISANEQALKAWDAASGALRFTIESPTFVVTSLAFSPDGSEVAVGGGEIKRFPLGAVSTVSQPSSE
jgi:WD40 repeat protein